MRYGSSLGALPHFLGVSLPSKQLPFKYFLASIPPSLAWAGVFGLRAFHLGLHCICLYNFKMKGTIIFSISP
jgi:hypothetical protein